MIFSFTWFGLSATLAALLSFIGLAHQEEPDDPLEELQFRLRSPIRYAISHPIRAIMRLR